MKPIRQIEKSFVLQEDGSDCGVACLLSLLKYYDSDSTLEHLRKLSRTAQNAPPAQQYPSKCYRSL